MTISIPGSGGRFRAVLALDELGLSGTGSGSGSGSGTGSGPAPVEFVVTLAIPDLPGYSDLPGRAEAAFVVEPEPRREELDLAVDAASLREWAEAAGGVYLPFWRYREAGGHLRDAATDREEVSVTRLWGRPWILLLVLASRPVVPFPFLDGWSHRARGSEVDPLVLPVRSCRTA